MKKKPKAWLDYTHGKLQLSVPIYLLRGPKTGGGIAYFKIVDSLATFTVDHEEIVSIGGTMGGGVEIDLAEHTFHIHSMDLWNAFIDALEASQEYPEVLKVARQVGKRSHRG